MWAVKSNEQEGSEGRIELEIDNFQKFESQERRIIRESSMVRLSFGLRFPISTENLPAWVKVVRILVFPEERTS